VCILESPEGPFTEKNEVIIMEENTYLKVVAARRRAGNKHKRERETISPTDIKQSTLDGGSISYNRLLDELKRRRYSMNVDAAGAEK
jgi:hypothetical protein